MSRSKRPTLAAVIPVYLSKKEDERYLIRALTSITSQSQIPDEVILTIDAPKSKHAIFRNLEKRFAELPLRFIDNFNGTGISSNSNNGIAASKSDLVHVLHQDDWLINLELYSLVSDSFLSHTDSFWLLSGKRLEVKVHPNFDVTAFLGNNLFGGPSGVIFPRLSNVSFDQSLSMLCDVDFVYQLILKLGKPQVVQIPSIEYGVSSGQAQNLIDRDAIIQEIRSLFIKHEVSKGQVFFYVITKYPSRVAFGLLKNLESSTDSNMYRFIIKLGIFYCRGITYLNNLFFKYDS